jgi:hypothetical protein
VNGRGQGKEGAGHDVFAEMPYDLMNGIRIADVKVESNQIVVRGDATAAYVPELGLKQFVREFVYKPGSGFVITDAVETVSPATFTLLLHADDKIEKPGQEFMIVAGGAKLVIDATIEDPRTLGQLQSTVEPNNLTAPGPPGAVDKGAQQVRGQKLVLTTARTTKARIVERLKIE